MGWLKKKGQKRWFLLLDDWLYWFPKEVPVTATTNQWLFLDHANGSVYLVRCNVLPGDKPKEFVIVNPSGKNYLLQAASEEERDQWITGTRRQAGVGSCADPRRSHCQVD